MSNLVQKLQKVNWDFSDYNSTKYPLDMNSIPWYPATFIPPIPKFLIALLSKPREIVLDPFGGKGTTFIESLKQGRLPIYNDLNSFAAEITNALKYAIKRCIKNKNYLNEEKDKLSEFQVPKNSLKIFAHDNEISEDVFSWYDQNTLAELFTIFNLMNSEKSKSRELYHIRKLTLSAILKPSCSQPGHFTYITDNCKPQNLVYKNALKLYTEKIDQISLSTQDMLRQFSLSNSNESLLDILKKAQIVAGDARKLDWIADSSVNLVLTSPPYLCAQDYIKTMRLTNLFFPNKKCFDDIYKFEIGPRNQRRGKSETVISKFYSDMNLVFSEIERVLVPDGYFCLIIGQGKSKVTAKHDIISDLCFQIKTKIKFKEVFHVTRKISSRVIQVGGVDSENIIIFQK